MRPEERLAQLEARHKELRGVVERLETLEARSAAIDAIEARMDALEAMYALLSGSDLADAAALDREGWAP